MRQREREKIIESVRVRLCIRRDEKRARESK